MGKHKQYTDGKDAYTKAEAKAAFPDPRFFDRAHGGMTMEQIEAITMRNVGTIRRYLDMVDQIARGQVCGRVTKNSLVVDANRLHDFHVSLGIQSGSGAGQPHLWEI